MNLHNGFGKMCIWFNPCYPVWSFFQYTCSCVCVSSFIVVVYSSLWFVSVFLFTHAHSHTNSGGNTTSLILFFSLSNFDKQIEISFHEIHQHQTRNWKIMWIKRTNEQTQFINNKSSKFTHILESASFPLVWNWKSLNRMRFTPKKHQRQTDE